VKKKMDVAFSQIDAFLRRAFFANAEKIIMFGEMAVVGSYNRVFGDDYIQFFGPASSSVGVEYGKMEDYEKILAIVFYFRAFHRRNQTVQYDIAYAVIFFDVSDIVFGRVADVYPVKTFCAEFFKHKIIV